MRRVLLFAHRWLGLTAGLIFAIAALTGGILVYQDELNDLLAGPKADITPGLVSPSVIESSARSKYPDSRLQFVAWPTSENPVFGVRMTDGKKARLLELDPGSGVILPTRETHILVRAIRQFHGSLLAGRVGRFIVTYSTFASIVSLLLGLFLWWPGLRTFARGFRIRWGKGLYAVTYDIHQTSGLFALPLLLLMSVTGVVMDSALMRSLTESSWPSPKSTETSTGGSKDGMNLEAVVQAVQAAAGGRGILRVNFPDTSDGVFEVWIKGASDWSSVATRIGLDRYTGALLARQDLRYDNVLNQKLHFGSIGGPIARILYAVSCLIGAGLFVTGLVMWWKRGKPVIRDPKMWERSTSAGSK
jgi:uncharacterized iron-regulated membrane protein